MAELTAVSTVLFYIGVLATVLAFVALLLAAVELVRGKPAPPRNFAVIVGATGIVLFCTKWVAPGHADELQNVSHVGTAFFMLGAGLQMYFHRRAAARL